LGGFSALCNAGPRRQIRAAAEHFINLGHHGNFSHCNTKRKSMDLLKHDIVSEFPEFKDKIHILKTSHPHFAKLYDTYDALNHAIAKVETGGAVMTDEALEEEKKKRLLLKDEIFEMLKKP
jgi:uncharacterized protein YdcH (DUF465 family)